ncbi:MAG: hypothetical protein ABJA78_06615 [Ferruginibacter sp.]
MKKVILFCLLATAAVTGKLSAQYYDPAYTQMSRTDQVFNVNNAQWLRHKFYISLDKGNHINIQVSDKTGLERMMNMDSLLKEVYSRILLINDSLKNELTNKRIDFAIENNVITRMRFQEFQPKGSSYGFQNKEIVLLKIEQDTINITGYNKIRPKWARPNSNNFIYEPYRIVILLNNIAELKDYLAVNLNASMQQLKADWDNYKKWTPKRNWDMKLLAVYNINNPQQNTKLHSVTYDQSKYHIDPLVQVSVQNVRNLFGPSAGAGLDISKYNSYVRELHFQLLWEPFFFFEKNSSNKTNLMRNDFITFQYKNIREVKPAKEKEAVKYYQQFSLSYLLHKDGEYFEKNTFRTGLPGFQYRNVSLIPEFIFHDFFKQFTPALKLSLYLE